MTHAQIWQIIASIIFGILAAHTPRAARHVKHHKTRKTAKRDRFNPRELAMYDAVTVANIPRIRPRWSGAVAGYVDGHWATSAELDDRYPHQYRVSITVHGARVAMCADVENGDLTIRQAVVWVRERLRAHPHERPWVYASVSLMPFLLAALARADVHREQLIVWTAHYGHGKHLCDHHCQPDLHTTADATQWTDRSHGRDLDQSLVAAGILHR